MILVPKKVRKTMPGFTAWSLGSSTGWMQPLKALVSLTSSSILGWSQSTFRHLMCRRIVSLQWESCCFNHFLRLKTCAVKPSYYWKWVPGTFTYFIIYPSSIKPRSLSRTQPVNIFSHKQLSSTHPSFCCSLPLFPLPVAQSLTLYETKHSGSKHGICSWSVQHVIAIHWKVVRCWKSTGNCPKSMETTCYGTISATLFLPLNYHHRYSS